MLTRIPEMILTATILMSLVAPHLAEVVCPQGTTELTGVGDLVCFALDLDAGKIDRDGAKEHCNSHFSNSQLVNVDTKVG